MLFQSEVFFGAAITVGFVEFLHWEMNKVPIKSKGMVLNLTVGSEFVFVDIPATTRTGTLIEGVDEWLTCETT